MLEFDGTQLPCCWPQDPPGFDGHAAAWLGLDEPEPIWLQDLDFGESDPDLLGAAELAAHFGI